MESLIETFHIDTTLLIAQMINFAIVFLALYAFALKPLLKTMKERTAKIEKGLKDAAEVDKRLKETEVEYKKEIARAKKEANDILEKAQISAEERKNDMVESARKEVEEIARREREKMEGERAAVVKEIRSEIADLVALSLEKLLEKRVDVTENNELVRRTVDRR